MCTSIAGKPLHAQRKVTNLYSISNSEVAVLGTSNVTDYACRLVDLTNNKNLEIQSTRQDHKIELEGATITLDANSFTCDNSLMNSDFKKAINSKNYPYIYVSFLNFELDANNPSATTQSFIPCQLGIKLAGVYKTYHGFIKTLELYPDRLILKGQLTLKMSDFNIDPPKAMFGMVQAEDQIIIGYNVTFKME